MQQIKASESVETQLSDRRRLFQNLCDEKGDPQHERNRNPRAIS
ncbi:protein of unknown function [Limnospira indica PCC 8005]|uniref:Uncharacterized protein n=1 Tax=Limnospira indica PCC 8005 TaxID=376219 RepID=A0A9P1P104_9CYAN|nr:protein of unknown function [Limnospira indica PCC 8005]